MQEAYIVAGFRSAVGKAGKGGFRHYRSDDLGADVIKHLIASVPELDPTRIDDLICGCAIPEAEQGMQVGRMLSLMALPQNVSGMTVNRYCGSGIETVALGVAKIKSGMAECIVAGGIESMSLLPMMGHKVALNYKVASEHPDWYLSMGITAEEVAKDYNITRADMDEFAYNSHMKALRALAENRFQDQIVPIEVEETYVDGNGKKESCKNAQ